MSKSIPFTKALIEVCEEMVRISGGKATIHCSTIIEVYSKVIEEEEYK